MLVVALVLHVVAANVYVGLRNGIVAGSPSDGVQAVISLGHLLVAVVVTTPLVRAAWRLDLQRSPP